MVWKKVNNSDAGDSTHFGGDDMDKVSNLFSGAAAEAAIFRDEYLIAADPTDTSKRVRLDAGGITTSTTRVLTAQDKDGTIATTTDTISTQYGGTGQDFSATSGLVKLSSGTASAVTAPSGDIVGTSDTQTLTNKTISGSSNTLSNIAKASITGAPTGDFVGTSDTQTLTNKTIDAASNTLSNIGNGSLTNSAITVTDGTTSTDVSLGGTVTFSGTSNEIEVGESSGTITVGLPNDVTISGNLTVNGTTTTINSTTLKAVSEGYQIKLLWGNEEEQQRANHIAALVPNVTVMSRLSLTEIAGQLLQADIIVAVDTGLAHLAAALDRPTVALYGASDPAKTGTYGKNQIHLSASLSCSPCLNRKCHYQGQDFNETEKESIFAVDPPCFSTVAPDRVWKNIESLTQAAH